jgi:hypothetical protein
VQLDPATDGALPLVVRFHVSSAHPISEPVWLVRGTVSSRDIKSLAAGQPSKALAERQVRTLQWDEEGAAVVAPVVKLVAGTGYSLVVPRLGWSRVFETMAQDPLPYLARVWPAPDSAAGVDFAIWCLIEPSLGVAAPGPATPTILYPGGVAGWIHPGALEGYGPGCIRWRAGVNLPKGPLVPPPLAMLADGVAARLEPTPLEQLAPTGPAGQPDCTPGMQPMGPCCAKVHDDRIALHCDKAWWLALGAASLRWTGLVSPSRPAVVRRLPADARVQISLTALDMAGLRLDWSGEVVTGPPQAHVVINEVMANPAGPEPQQEWVELYNDGTEAADLLGWSLEDAGGSTKLTPCRLDAGQYALVVNAGYDASSWVDRPAVPGTQIVRVARLGVDGISNAGEPLRLRTVQGDVVSSVPALASPKQAVSIARAVPEAPDNLEASFVRLEGGGTPGAPNRD